MSAIEGDNWCYVSRIAVESLGWDLDDRRQSPTDHRPNLVSAEEGEKLTVANATDEETVTTHWLSSDTFEEVSR